MENQNIFDRGVAKVKNVVSEVSIEQRAFLKSFVRLCQDGWDQGWHESNGGNLSYRMTLDEVAAYRSYFNENPGPWVQLGIQAQGLQGEHFAVTGTGSHFRTLANDPSGNIGIIEINQAGDSWRLVWGLKHGGRPTSEFPSHFMIHAVRKAVSNGADRVIYHAHPAHVAAMSLVMAADSKLYSQALWKSLSESIMVIPEGVGVSPWMVPGSQEIARETGTLMETHRAVVWPHHGVFCASPDFDQAFGVMHTIEKTSGIFLTAKAAEGGEGFAQVMTDDDVRATAKSFGVVINEAYLG